MNFFTRTVPWANWQFGVLKLAMLALGVMIGAYFADFFKPYLWLVGLIFLATTIWVTIMWVRAMRETA
jgi:putative Mn2+ efflux pump MntP